MKYAAINCELQNQHEFRDAAINAIAKIANNSKNMPKNWHKLFILT